MQAIVTYRKFHDIGLTEVPPEVFLVKEPETGEVALERIWQDQYNALLAEGIACDDLLEEEECWHEKDMAIITWADGDVKEFYLVDVEEYVSS